MTEEAEFGRRVESWIELLVEQGELDFACLVRQLPGVDPIYVVDALKRLGQSRCSQQCLHLLDQACCPTVYQAPVSTNPFVPHPLDFDWRFTAATARHIVHQVLSLTKPARVALLGTPTLIAAIEDRLPSQSLQLFDKNSLWRDRINSEDPLVTVTVCDLTQDDLQVDDLGEVDVVIMDPPWYPTIQRAYFWAAAQLIRPGGFIVTTVPPKGTRPLVVAERAEMEAYAASVGLVPVAASEGTLRYVTPPFEVNALRAARVFHALSDWRSGDLSIYQSRRACFVDRPKMTSPGFIWAEVMIRGVRIKMRLNSPDVVGPDQSPDLIPVVEGDVLPSLSTRHPVRDQVDVWTSGNRVFKCRNTRALLELCESLRDNVTSSAPGSYADARSPMKRNALVADRVVSQVLAIVAMESNEYLSR